MAIQSENLEKLANKDTDGTLSSNSDIKYPSQKAVKTYVDALNIDATTMRDVILNVMLNAFRIAQQGSLTLLNMVDGFVDEYEDESGIDTSASTYEYYDSSGDFYRPISSGSVDENCKLLLHMDGDNDSTTFTDASPAEHGNATVSGDAKVKTATKKWGTGSLLLDGTDYLYYADSSDWDVFSSLSTDWTIDWWFKFNDYSTPSNQWFLQHNTGNNSDGWGFYKASTTFRFWLRTGGVTYFNGENGAIPQDTDWHHCAYIKVGDDLGIYLDGTQVGYELLDRTINLSGNLYIGNYYGGVSGLNGYMDEISIVNYNIFSATPVSGKTDTISVPTSEYGTLIYDNMTLISNNQIPTDVPTEARIVIFEEDVNSITLNTDLKAYISRDDGANYSQVTLEDVGNYISTARVLHGTVDISGQPSDTDVVYKLTTHNNKNLKIHGVGISWKF